MTATERSRCQARMKSGRTHAAYVREGEKYCRMHSQPLTVDGPEMARTISRYALTTARQPLPTRRYSARSRFVVYGLTAITISGLTAGMAVFGVAMWVARTFNPAGNAAT